MRNGPTSTGRRLRGGFNVVALLAEELLAHAKPIARRQDRVLAGVLDWIAVGGSVGSASLIAELHGWVLRACPRPVLEPFERATRSVRIGRSAFVVATDGTDVILLIEHQAPRQEKG